MIRVFGFLVGSAVSIGLLLLILGIPDIEFTKSAIENAEFEQLSKTVEAAKTDIETVAVEVDKEISNIVNALPENEPPPEYAALEEFDKPVPGPEQNAVSAAEREIQSADHGGEINMSNKPGEQDLKWHSFWNPFRSEIAANGFVTQLEKVTGFDYRVVKMKTGVYEVTFAYANDSERRKKLSQIASATGLDLPDS